MSLRPTDYIDVAWLVGDLALRDLPIPAYAPIWSVEHNQLEFLGPRTHQEVSVAPAIRTAIALPI
ncbi:MAG: hypothetical protein Q8M22_16520 [Actinomycetota bacterium]|nr:hypothetical protein [Actinomycetota bacterium]